MRVHVEKDIYINGDHRSYQVEQRTVIQSGDNAGKEQFTPQGYYSNIQQCITAILKMKIADSTATTLNELLNDVKRIEGEVRALIQH